MPFCPQCGSDNPSTARFCDQCGSTLIPVPGQGTNVAVPPSAPTTQPGTPVAGVVSAGPTVCPQCGTAVIPGEAFCDTCGASLLGPTRPATGATAPGLPYSGVPPQPSYPPPQAVSPPVAPQPTSPPIAPPQPVGQPQPVVRPPVVTPPVPARSTLAPSQLRVQPGGAVVVLPSTDQAVLGRADAVSNFYPDIDLSAYGALEQGVGRRHARLFVEQGQLMVEDLDSTNGTLVNTNRLTPRQPTPLKPGDELRLGNLVLRLE